MTRSPAWLRPKTTKLYLHAPLSERIAILSPDLKLLSLSLLDDGTHVGQPGVGLHLLHGKKMIPYDMERTKFDPVQGGLPIYTARATGACDLALEAFCTEERNPTIYFKITLKNTKGRAVRSAIGLMPRSGQEKYMVNQHQEGYSPYTPNYKNWFMLKRTWTATDSHNACSDMGYLTLSAPASCIEWVADNESGHRFEAADYFRISYTLGAGESLSLTGALRAKEAIAPFAYDEKKEEAIKFWKNVTDSIKLLPSTDDPFVRAVYLHTAVQCTQMLARYEGRDEITVRQGDVARLTWPYEGVQVLTMLDKLGLSEHTGKAYRKYCECSMIKEGDDRGKITAPAGWENFTGSVVYGISEHLLSVRDEKALCYFLPYLLTMRDWIEKRRHEARTEGYEGIFPVGRGSDWSDHAQFWTFTDSHNAMAYRSLYRMLQSYDHPAAKEAFELYEDYANTIFKIRDELYRGHEDDQSFILPHELGIPFEDSETYSYYTDGAPYLLYTGFIEPGSKMQKQMEEFFCQRGQFEKGLTGRMTSCSSMWDEAYFGGYGDVWYTMQSETYWIRAWVASGEHEKARKSLEALMTYGMTEEYVIAERYCSINPWYSPWQPNASGSARMLECLLIFYGEKAV